MEPTAVDSAHRTWTECCFREVLTYPNRPRSICCGVAPLTALLPYLTGVAINTDCQHRVHDANPRISHNNEAQYPKARHRRAGSTPVSTQTCRQSDQCLPNRTRTDRPPILLHLDTAQQSPILGINVFEIRRGPRRGYRMTPPEPAPCRLPRPTPSRSGHAGYPVSGLGRIFVPAPPVYGHTCGRSHPSRILTREIRVQGQRPRSLPGIERFRKLSLFERSCHTQWQLRRPGLRSI